jgi:restriction system protein
LIQNVSTPIAEEIEKNAGPLRVERLHTTQPDKYGTIPWQKWDRATVHYTKTRIPPILLASNASSVTFDWLRLVDSSIEEASRRPWTPAMAEQHGYVSSPECFDVRMDPLDYEAFCSLQLGKAGWVTRLTVATHDQGADIVAERSGRKLVVQRKLYSSPVGNEAVQQVHAAMTFQLADLAAVVSNQPFTRSAHQLAGVNGVRLLHHDQLPAFTG